MTQPPTVSTKLYAVPAESRRVRVDAARHAEQADDVHREEQQVRADEDDPEADLARPLEVHAPGHLREPVVHPAEDREDRGAEDDVVEVRDDEVRVGDLLVERNRDEHDPGEAADDEQDDEADDEQQRRLELRPPVKIVDDHANTWIVDGMTTIAVAPAKKTSDDRRDPGREHVVRPHAEADEDDEELGDRDEREGDHLPLRERGMISVAMPKAGTMRMYTSGWPKNQNRCCQSSVDRRGPGRRSGSRDCGRGTGR